MQRAFPHQDWVNWLFGCLEELEFKGNPNNNISRLAFKNHPATREEYLSLHTIISNYLDMIENGDITNDNWGEFVDQYRRIQQRASRLFQLMNRIESSQIPQGRAARAAARKTKHCILI
jgi:hypothetical protein